MIIYIKRGGVPKGVCKLAQMRSCARMSWQCKFCLFLSYICIQIWRCILNNLPSLTGTSACFVFSDMILLSTLNMPLFKTNRDFDWLIEKFWISQNAKQKQEVACLRSMSRTEFDQTIITYAALLCTNEKVCSRRYVAYLLQNEQL